MTTQRRRWILDGDQPVRLARSCTAKTIADWGIPQLDENAAIAVSELATNAFVHGIPPVELELVLTGTPPGRQLLLIEVSDRSTALPIKRPPGDNGGFGLSVLEEITDLSVEPNDGGKVVRARLKEPE